MGSARRCSSRCSTTPTTTGGPATSSRATRGTSACTSATGSWRRASCTCPTVPTSPRCGGSRRTDDLHRVRDRVSRRLQAHPYDGPPMASISREEVAHVAKLARLELTDEQLDTFTPQLAAILEHAADVEALDLADVPPTSHPYPLSNVTRPDVVRDAGIRDA